MMTDTFDGAKYDTCKIRISNRLDRRLFAGLALSAAIVSPALAEPPKPEPARPVQSPDHEVSPAVLALRTAWADKSILPLTLRHMDDVHNTRTVPHAGDPWPLPRNDQAPDFTYSFEGQTFAAEDVLDRTYTNALLIIKDGKIVYETYRNGSDETDRFAGFSMTKSVTSILVGCAVQEGRVNIADPIDKYLPELKGGGYEGVSVRHILQMRSGADRIEDYSNLRDREKIDPQSPEAAVHYNVARYTDAAATVKRSWEPGSHYNYLNLDTAVLGLLIERVTDRSISAYATQCLWEPLGAEADGFFIMDGKPGVGREFNAAGFNATLRDWARIGLMMLNDGRAKEQIIPAGWVSESTAPVPTGENTGWGYGYQWWTVDGSQAYAARGMFGQHVYVDPATRTVIAKMSYVPGQADQPNIQKEVDAFFKAASEWSPE